MDFRDLGTIDIIYLVISAVLICLVLLGIFLMSKIKHARLGNGLSACAMLIGIILVLFYNKVFDFNYKETYEIILSIAVIFFGIISGSIIGLLLNKKVQMIQMPQLVALLNGLGGAASALVGIVSLCFQIPQSLLIRSWTGYYYTFPVIFSIATSALAIAVGMITLSGSLVAAGKLHRILPQKAIVLKNHQLLTVLTLSLSILSVVLSALLYGLKVISINQLWILAICNVIFSTLFGLVFSIRVGGADMPITISLLNSFSGVAGAIAGLALHDILLVAIGGIVGASGLILTQIMCKAINRSLMDILLGKAKKTSNVQTNENKSEDKSSDKQEQENLEKQDTTSQPTADPFDALRNAKDVIIVPGYGMAIAQAQHLVKKLADNLVKRGAKVRYAIHPVAGRMPGHMNVLLCEADVDYEDLFEMSDIDNDFKTADCTIVVGANDVLNPAANTAVGTPIYGMPVLSVSDCKEIYIFNYDTNPGYAGVDNPLYKRENGVHLFLGNAKDTLNEAIDALDNNVAETSKENAPETNAQTAADPFDALRNAKDVIIVPGYGMAIAQAQHLVKKLADNLVKRGAKVRYAIHPVAGRMPGHMNVLLCEADVDYEDLFEMSDIDNDFKTADCTIVVGANDVLNPAANTAVGTPIYGMPVLSVSDCKEIYIFNYDTNPGYAGVDNPLYKRENGVHLFLGNAKDTLNEAIDALTK